MNKSSLAPLFDWWIETRFESVSAKPAYMLSCPLSISHCISFHRSSLLLIFILQDWIGFVAVASIIYYVLC